MVVVAPSGRGRHGDGATARSGGRVGELREPGLLPRRGERLSWVELTAIVCHLIGSGGTVRDRAVCLHQASGGRRTQACRPP